MSLTLTITDSTESKTYTEAKIGAPLTISDVTGKSQNTTLNGNVYIDYIYNKKSIKVTLPKPSAADYEAIRAFYDRQFTTNHFPTISIPELNISNMVVAMEISSREITSKCLESDDIELTFRETIQP